ncbi:MAG TPA: HD domain-containing phosphohydrolase [Abditibacteriaceae bacterium]|jgi:HD-GYP domain-containing protein (c-di-GMP phosphodiesterase class II)
MELQPAGGWRVETGQVVSEITERLLAWMTVVHATVSRAHTAASVGQGLMALLEAEGAAVLVRDGGRLAPMWLSWHENRRSEDRDESHPIEYLDGGLLAVVGDTPFFSDTATPPVQILLGDACDILFETGAPQLTTADTVRDTSLYAMAQQATIPELPSLVVPLVNESGTEGVVLLWIATPDGLVGDEFRIPLQAAARQAGALLASARACELGGSAERDFSALLAEAADMREPYRVGHSPNVAHWCGVIARGMNLSESDVEHCELAGLLHAMGKLTIPDEILQKSLALSDEERSLVRKAIVSGGDQLMQVRGLEEVALAVRHQGEWWNGSGLPDGLAGEAIPLEARILAVALRFCAMTRSRAGRRAMSVVGGAFETLANDAGTALDPKVVRAFLATMGRRLDAPRPTPPAPESSDSQ